MDNNDWRLQGQEYLMNVELIYSKFKKPSLEWDHEHCSFCWDKFSEYDGTLHEGYCTLDQYHWICEKCFSDFKEMFNWKVIDSK
ncbi:MAG: hypothetical protein LBO62_04450 [Endomicrobium sp.]|jgi:hypothetical protein|nr:hypothetical protein [Endomicrobium sp.]